jgi:hypothetical protein
MAIESLTTGLPEGQTPDLSGGGDTIAKVFGLKPAVVFYH